MKAICKRAFTVDGRSYKPGDEVEASPTKLKAWAWHGYVELPTMPERVAEATTDAVEKVKGIGARIISPGKAVEKILEITGFKKNE